MADSTGDTDTVPLSPGYDSKPFGCSAVPACYSSRHPLHGPPSPAVHACHHSRSSAMHSTPAPAPPPLVVSMATAEPGRPPRRRRAAGTKSMSLPAVSEPACSDSSSSSCSRPLPPCRPPSPPRRHASAPPRAPPAAVHQPGHKHTCDSLQQCIQPNPSAPRYTQAQHTTDPHPTHSMHCTPAHSMD